MATKIRVKARTMRLNGKKLPATATPKPPMQQGERRFVPVSQIDFSPLNYRKYYSEKALETFAKDLLLHGIISDLTLRPLPNGRFELVAGERRLRAARIAGISEVPATIKILRDDEVREIQLAENLQREDPHPLDDAEGIRWMQEGGDNIDQIAARLGKSKGFVYGRLQLLSLVEAFREMFFADCINLQEAVEIAGLSPESQEELFNEHCQNWKEEKGFQLENLHYLLSRYRYDLKKAPFDTKDKLLLPDKGACTACPYNSATLKTLFPEYAKQAICSNQQCFSRKCTAHIEIRLRAALLEHRPQAVLMQGKPEEEVRALLEAIPEAEALPVYSRYDVVVLAPPPEPLFTEFFSESEEGLHFDQEAYDVALIEHLAGQDEFNEGLESGEIKKALCISSYEIRPVFFTTERQRQNNGGEKITSKQVQEAIKTKTATPELLEAEIERLQKVEERAKELDRVKVQEAVHHQLSEQLKEGQVGMLTSADLLAARLLVYQSLDYSGRNEVARALFDSLLYKVDNESDFLVTLANLTDEQYSYLIRVALSRKSDSKLPSDETGKCLYRVAASAGIDTAGIEEAQKGKAEARLEKMEGRVASLNKLLQKLQAAQ